MIRLLFTTLFIVLAISGIAQQKKHKVKVQSNKRYNYRIEISIWNDAPVFETAYILDNSQINFYDSTDERKGILKPMMFYCISNISRVDKPDTASFVFSKKEADNLFTLTSNFLNTFHISNVDKQVNDANTITIVNDDAQARVALSLGERKLSATIYSLSNPQAVTKEFKVLLNYIRKYNSTHNNNGR